ncbi:MAG: xanthine dehydrogenase small subunit [Xanthomonadales bacterium]
MADGIRFLLGERAVEVKDIDPQTTVLDWLRIQAQRMGTKEGCAEGDCGACTVVVGELQGDSIRYRAFNACILLLATLDGKQLITVEDLASDGLHPVQRALVDHDGSQCGFCTPGFVMSLFAMVHANGRQPGGTERAAIDEGLAGNLCRCTGYAPIVRAAEEVLAEPVDDSFSANREQTVSALKAIERKHGLELAYEGRRFYSPRSIDELCRLLARHPDAVLLAGGTDVGLWITKQLRILPTLIYTANVPELQRLEIDEAQACLEIGAAVSYTDAMETLCAHYPDFRPLLSRFGALQVRNAGTIGGNIANGSPIGDMPPPLIALGARLVLRSAAGSRELDLEDFFIEYGKQDLRAGECVDRVLLPVPDPQAHSDLHFRVYKLGKRFDQDISAVCAAFALRLEGEIVQSIRICYGGMAGMPARARKTESVLLGARWSQEIIDHAKAAMTQDYQPLTDWRASGDYRMLASQNLLQRFYLETTTDEPVQVAPPVAAVQAVPIQVIGEADRA